MGFRIAKSLAVVPAMCLIATAHAETLSALKSPVPSAVSNATVTGTMNPSTVLHLTVNLPCPNLSSLQAFADSVSNPASANYQKFITPAQFGQMYGQPTTNVNAVVNYLKSQGFTIKLVGANNLNILADATVAQAQAAFHTTIKQFHSTVPGDPERTDFYSYTSTLQVPSAIAPLIESASGLENHTKGIPRHVKFKKATTLAATVAKKQSGPVPLTPIQASVLYNDAPLHTAGFSGQGRTVGISSFDAYRLTNIPLWYSQYGLPAPAGGVGSNIKVEVVGTATGTGTVTVGEGDLDIQMVLGQAPLCNLVIYDGSDLISVLAQEANDNTCDLFTESYGWRYDATLATTAHTSHLQMTAQGQTYLKATGDSGTALAPFSYGDYDPEILGVGGTVATFDSTGKRINEIAWSEGGGGWVTTPVVSFNTLPSWQKGTGVPTGINFRLVPDVAAAGAGSNGNDDPGAFFFYLGGTLQTGDGTSFSSPVFTGCLTTLQQALIAKNYILVNSAGKFRMGNIAPLIYGQNGRPDVWFDVVSGSNGSLPNGQISTANTGWDFTTGWGPMNFAAELAALTAQPPITIGPSATPAIFVYNGKALGSNASGTASSVVSTDGVNFSENSISYTSGATAATTFTYKLTKALANIATAQLTFVDSAPTGTTLFLYLKNAKTGAYDSPFSTVALKTSNVKTVVNIDLTKYADANGNISLLAEAIYPTRLGGNPFVHKVDQATITEAFK